MEIKDMRPIKRVSTEWDDSSDVTLLEEMKKGNQQALEILMTRHASRLGAIVMRIVGRQASRADIEEAVADCFVTAWRQADQFDPGRAPVSGWLAHIARYRAKTLGRKLQRQGHEVVGIDHITEFGGVVEPEGFAEVSVEQVSSEERLRELRSIFDRLAPRDITIIQRRFIEDRSPQEIAAELDMTPNAVRVRLSRALRRLRVGLAALESEGT
jgi:RNA polymerase sigma-70 factor, ECF subfamily